MREDNPFECRARPSRFADQNQPPTRKSTVNNQNNAKGSGNISKAKSLWGSQLVKGFTTEKKTKLQKTIVVQTKKLPETATQKGTLVDHSRVKRSLISDLSCPVSATQVHPHNKTVVKSNSIGSCTDLFVELDQLRGLLQASKEREFKLQAELSECKRNPKVLELEKEVELKKDEIDGLTKKVELLESEKSSLSDELMCLKSVTKREGNKNSNSVEMEVLELRRMNKELQLEKRNLACRLSSMETQFATLAKVPEDDVIEKIKAEASFLRHTNEDLCKQVEGLQISRLNEVEELAYLRWVNSCLRNELRNCSTVSSNKVSSPTATERSAESISLSSDQSDEDFLCSSTKRLHLIKKLKKWPITDEDIQQSEFTDGFVNHSWDGPLSSTRRHSISGSKFCPDEMIPYKRRQSDAFVCSWEVDKEMEPLDSQHYDSGINPRPYASGQEVSKVTASLIVEKRALRIPNPPPRPSCTILNDQREQNSTQIALPPLPPPPPPPPPPPKIKARSTTATVQRAPQVVEFYHSLMKRDSRKDSINTGVCDASEVANVRSSMIGEIENRSSHLLAIKADVETQGEFVNYLIQEVNNAVYQDIEDVVAFVKWLDDELSFLVDERAVLKHFDWPERKADTLREAAFTYRDLRKIEHEASNFRDSPQLPSDIALKKMVALSERMERTVYGLLRTRDSLMRHCKDFQIPTDWMLDSGILSKIKLSSVKLATMYMKRVAMELQFKGASDKDSSMDYMLLQGVRFAFRIHQFAGGFDSETMHAFEELRDLAIMLNKT